jgi:hypothetical protein
MKPLTSYSALIILLAACNSHSASDKQPSSQTATTPVYSCYNAKTTDKAWYSEGKKAPMLKGLQGIDFRISTLVMQKKNDQAAATKLRFNKSWLYADLKIGSSSPL